LARLKHAPETMQNRATRDEWGRRAVALILLLGLLRLWITWGSELTDTEAYYASWARWPSLGYYDHPPLVAWTSWLVSRVGTSGFVMRLMPAACLITFELLVNALARRMFSPRAAFLAVLVISMLPAFVGIGSLVNPEALLAPLWLVVLIALYDLRAHDEAWRPLVLGVAIGVAFLAKYTGLLAVPLVVTWVSASRETRRWLRRPSFWIAGLVALAIASPVIVWNAQRGFPSVRLHLVDRVAHPSLAAYAGNAMRVVLSQLAMFHPVALPGFVVVAIICVARARSDWRFRFLAWTSLPMLAFFFAMMLRVRDAEPHWTMTGYVPLAIGMGALLDEAFERRLARAYVGGLVTSSAVALAAFLVCSAYAWAPWNDAINETLGWDRITSSVRRQAESLGGGAVVASHHNVLCGHLAWALHDTPNVYCASERRTELDFVGRRRVPRESPVVYVDSERYPRAPSDALEGRSCTLGERLEIERGGRVVQTMRIWSCPAEPANDREERQARR
jgi:4-amino-4-deoxy-L-arabinose transferase-like glycosyltransferase